jgi:Rod binding domain-containing protein
MGVNGISGTSAAQDYGPAGRPKGIEGAAASFEALFIGNLLKSVREASQATLGGEGDQAGSTMMDVAEEYLANDIAKGGGLGLAKMVASQFAAQHLTSGASE